MPEDSAAHAVDQPESVQQPERSQPAHQRPAYWFKPGQSGNPLGYQAPLRSFASHIRQETGYGKEIAAFYLAVMRGEPIKMPSKIIRKGKNGRKISVLYVRPTLDQRIDAAAWLADRGWGKAKETIELTGEASPAQRLELLKRLSDDERAQLKALLARALDSNATTITVTSSNSESTSALLQTPDSVESQPASEPAVDPT